MELTTLQFDALLSMDTVTVRSPLVVMDSCFGIEECIENAWVK